MADDLLFFKFHLRERSRFTIRNKKRIVTEAHVADRSVVDFAAAFAFENNWLADDKFTLSVLGHGLVRKSAEVASLAVFNAFELLHQLDVVGFVIAVLTAVAGAVNARFAVQREKTSCLMTSPATLTAPTSVRPQGGESTREKKNKKMLAFCVVICYYT